MKYFSCNNINVHASINEIIERFWLLSLHIKAQPKDNAALDKISVLV